MAYFFVLKGQTAFDVRWCRGNVGDMIFRPWVKQMEASGKVDFRWSTRAVGFEEGGDGSSRTRCLSAVKVAGEDGTKEKLDADAIIFAVGMGALKAFSRMPVLGKHPEFARFGNLRGTDVLAVRVWLDRDAAMPYSANACWGFDEGVGMTTFDIKKLQAPLHDGEPGAIIEMDFYHAGSLLPLSDAAIVDKVRANLASMVPAFAGATVVDSAVVRLPAAVNWYFPGSYKSLPSVRSEAFANAYFAGDVVKTSHGSWSQEKAYVTGVEAANAVLGRSPDHGIVPLRKDEPHVAVGRDAVRALRGVLGEMTPSLASFFR